MKNNFFDYLHATRASLKNSDRRTDPRDNSAFLTHREIWSRATKAAARKATADGVNGIALDETGGRFYIFQISGYTPERGIFCDILNEAGQVVKTY